MSAEADRRDEKAEELAALGLDGPAAKTAASSDRIFEATIQAFKTANLKTSDSNRAGLIYSAVTKMPAKFPDAFKDFIYATIGSGKITTNAQLEAGVEFMQKLKVSSVDAIDNATFDAYCGVGVEVTEDDIRKAVEEVLTEKREEILTRRYRTRGILLKAAREKIRFVDGKIFREEIESQLVELLGPETEEDKKPPVKTKKKKEKKVETTPSANDNNVGESLKEVDPLDEIPSMFEARDLENAKNSPELVEKQKRASGGKVICRFPPEPNGYLHIGHAKAMFLDFGYAKKNGGDCILRFDDTNPAGEEMEYINGIIEMVEWLGHKPVRVTYSSDYFGQLFELAKELIRRDKAFICHQTQEEMTLARDSRNKVPADSPWRNRPIEESLAEFENMRRGKYAEGDAVLRMKIDMQSVNPAMRDPVAYRVIHAPHPKSGDEWCVYPTYDFTHCLVDSLEWVTHSLCTLEFETRRDPYYWVLAALDLYRPFVWEFSRLNLEYTVVSKRKLLKLVRRKYVTGWDDPRMPTLVALRRRGVPPEAVNKFCSRVGFSRGENTIGMHVLEHAIRSELDTTVVRAKAVLQPLKVTIVNFEKESEVLCISNHPTIASMGTHQQTLTKNVFIERSDFRMVDEKGYFGLAPGKSAMLRHAYPITVVDVVVSKDGEPTELLVEYDKEKSMKPKGVLHWVSASPHSQTVEVRLYDHLFKSAEQAEEVDGEGEVEKAPKASDPDAFLDDVNPESFTVIRGALVESFAAEAKPGDRFQFERVGFFVCDTDSTAEEKVFTRTITLKDSFSGSKK